MANNNDGSNGKRRLTSLQKLLNAKRQRNASRTKRLSTPGKSKPKRKPILTESVLDWNLDASPEPFENEINYKGMWGCLDVPSVERWLDKGWDAFNRKALGAVSRRKLPAEMKSDLKNLLSKPGATSIPNLVSREIGKAAWNILVERLVALTEQNPEIEVGLVTFIDADGETSHLKTDIDLHRGQKKVVATLRAMAPNFFGISELALFNNYCHADGGQMTHRHEHALIVGPDVLANAKIIAAKRAKRFRRSFTDASPINVKKVSTDRVNLARVSAYLLKPPYRCKNWCPPIMDRAAFTHGSEKGDRMIRYLRLAQIRSMMTIEQATFGSGEGKTIRSDMIKYLRARAAKDAAGGQQILHPDAIASFWVDLGQALNEEWNLPIIRTR